MRFTPHHGGGRGESQMRTLQRQRWYIACAAVVLLSGCGQKGPLYLPDKKASVVPPVPAAPPASTPPEKADPDQKDDSQQPATP